MITVNSLSGGKTSSYMAANYPTNYNIFALLRIDAEYCKPKDESLIRYISDKIQMDFIATAESDTTLYAMRNLEQLIGNEIIWVTGDSFDTVCKKKKAIPNLMQRFCTSEMKIIPIAEWWKTTIDEKIQMQVGFRFDEKERADRFTNEVKLKVGKSENGRNKWKVFNWREGKFPLIENKIFQYDVIKWARSSGITFPNDSNCVGCFWKPYQQLRKNWDLEPLKMRYFSELEIKHKRKFTKELTYIQIKEIGLQSDFIFGTGSGCQAGFCTD